DRRPERRESAIELRHRRLIRQARHGDQAQRPAGKAFLLPLLPIGHMAMGARRQQCAHHRAPQSAGARAPPPPAMRPPPRAPERRCRRLPPRDDRENPSDPPVSSASIRRRSPPLVLVLALQLEAQLAALHGDGSTWAITPMSMGVAATWLRSTGAPTVFCHSLGKGFR